MHAIRHRAGRRLFGGLALLAATVLVAACSGQSVRESTELTEGEVQAWLRNIAQYSDERNVGAIATTIADNAVIVRVSRDGVRWSRQEQRKAEYLDGLKQTFAGMMKHRYNPITLAVTLEEQNRLAVVKVVATEVSEYSDRIISGSSTRRVHVRKVDGRLIITRLELLPND